MGRDVTRDPGAVAACVGLLPETLDALEREPTNE
jgi:hypothetical protein